MHQYAPSCEYIRSTCCLTVRKPVGKVVGLGRFELPTHGLGNRCSILLSYRPTSGIAFVLHPKPTIATRNVSTHGDADQHAGAVVAGPNLSFSGGGVRRFHAIPVAFSKRMKP